MNTEILGVTKVKQLIAKSDYLVPNINDNDKTPSWDGDVEVYRTPGNTHRKDDLIIRVPVQVKGHCQNIHPHRVSFSVEVADLRNYLNADGTIFFVVYVDEEGEKKTAYYKEFLPFDLKKILKECTGQKRKTIHLNTFPTEKASIANIFLNFTRDMQKQKAYITCEPVSLDSILKDGKFTELSFGYTAIKRDDAKPFDYLFENRLYLYADYGNGIEMPIEHIDQISSASTVLDLPVSINGMIYFNQYTVIYKKDETFFQFGKGITIKNNQETKKLTISLKYDGTLNERIRDYEFITAAIKAEIFEVNGVQINLSEVLEEARVVFESPEQKQICSNMKRIQETLDKLHIKTDLNVNNLDNKSRRDLDTLIDSILDGKEVSLVDTSSTFGVMTIGNLKILVFVMRNEKTGLYTICDIYSKTMIARIQLDDGTEVQVPVGLTLKRDSLIMLDNVDYNEIIAELSVLTKELALFGVTVNFLLEILHAYDNSIEVYRKRQLIYGAQAIIDWLIKNDNAIPDEVHLLNELQIIKRQRSLNEEEIEHLNVVIETGNEREDILTGAYLLLDNQVSAERHFNKMNSQLQESFKQYPIFHYWKSKEDIING